MSEPHKPDDELKTLLATLWKNTIAPHKLGKDAKEESIGVLDTIVSVSAGVKKPLPKSASESQATLMSVSVKGKGVAPKASDSQAATFADVNAGPSGTKVATSSTRSASPTKRAGSTFVAAEKLASVSASRLNVLEKSVSDSSDPQAAELVSEFEIIRVLGQGGMGVVYEARQAALDRNIALKMIKTTMAQDQDVQAVFLAEAAVTGELEHPGVVPIYDLGIQADGVLFYGMKQVKGMPWNKVLNKKQVQENIEVLLKVADAIAFGHSKGIIHRDLKPENIMLGEFGEVLVMDWGLAASVVDNGKIGRLTVANAAGGTPAYMAPEMATGNVELIGYRSDVYLLGAILYEIVTGLRPHTGKDMMAVLYNIATNVIQATDKKGELVEIALKAMSTKPEDRYASVKDLQTAIKDSQKHFESISLADKAAERLEKANKSQVYEDYAQALFGFQQALELWNGNRVAQKGVDETRLAYTRRAIAKDDIDLASSLIEPVRKQYPQVVQEIERMRADREAKRKRLKVLTYGSAGLAATILIGVTVAYFLVSAEKEKAVAAEQVATRKEAEARVEKERAEQQTAIANQAKDRAEKERKAAELAREEAEAQKVIALASEEKARKNEELAKIEKENVVKEKEKVEKAVKEMLAAQDATEAAKAREKLAEVAKEKLGLVLTANKNWIFDAQAAAKKQEEAATALGKPVNLEVALPQNQKLALVAIPGGEYVRGSEPTEANRTAEEYLVTIRVTHPFYLGKFELTAAQWKAITGTEAPVGSGAAPEGNLPVTNINAEDVQKLLLPKLNAFAPAGFEFRLPTEAEWEWACRAGTNSPFYCGSDAANLEKAACFRYNSKGSVQPAGAHEPNAFGLYDMHGNVSELCKDSYVPNFYISTDATPDDPFCGADSKFRVARGGSWVNLPQHIRSAYRSYVHIENRYDFMGVRVVLAKVVPAK
ncbi:MAG: SUMF1/EgtB/PvdO family nonheme iron enzyme [Planctomycetota bacterium]|nr:SUMF1/EgtB/PvdO family nonheme iron enzyme [Planctomycetota bacterium]